MMKSSSVPLASLNSRYFEDYSILNYPIGCIHEWLLLVSSPHRLQEYQARASPTLTHLLHANSCISCRNLLPVVHVAWLGWHGGTVRNSEH